jgi:hypothetical protein
MDKMIIYEHIPTETFLLFQTDSMILKENKDNIYDFLQYDYVGAPWVSCKPNGVQHGDVGNGGFSLRKKSKMIEIIEREEEERKALPEDVFFAKAEKVFVYKPDAYEASRFSMEAIYGCGKPFGIHKVWGFIPHVLDKYPEIQILYSLQ